MAVVLTMAISSSLIIIHDALSSGSGQLLYLSPAQLSGALHSIFSTT